MTCTKAALWVPNTNSLTHANLTRRQTSDIRRQYILRAMLRRTLLVLVLLPCSTAAQAPGELLELMITRSSNLATNILIERVGAARAQASARTLGAWSIQVLRGVEDGKAYRARLNNTTTARDLGVLLAAIAGRRAASPASCDTMLAILGRQECTEGIPAGVPPGTRVAHKTGWIGEVVYHDAAIVHPATGRSYGLVVLTGGIKQDSVASDLVADLSRMVYDGAALAGAMR